MIGGLLGLLGGCRSPSLSRAPFAFLEPGRTGVAIKQPLANRHTLDGKFDVGPVQDPFGGPPNFYHVEDEGEIKGKYELSLALRQVITESTTVEFGIGYRQYEIEGLQPAPDPNIEFMVDTVNSLQFYAALRHYFDGPDWLSERWKWFLEAGFYFIPSVAVDSRLQFLTTSQPISSKGAPFEVLGLTAGAAYAFSDDLLFEFGFTWEEPLEDLSVDLSTSVDFGSGQVIEIPIEAAMRPVGGLIFFSLTWFPFA